MTSCLPNRHEVRGSSRHRGTVVLLCLTLSGWQPLQNSTWFTYGGRSSLLGTEGKETNHALRCLNSNWAKCFLNNKNSRSALFKRVTVRETQRMSSHSSNLGVFAPSMQMIPGVGDIPHKSIHPR
jgi:hypothetical protein